MAIKSSLLTSGEVYFKESSFNGCFVYPLLDTVVWAKLTLAYALMASVHDLLLVSHSRLKDISAASNSVVSEDSCDAHEMRVVLYRGSS